ncbi:MAG: hypothetical protein WDN31_03385 [Hyphomicrobium sp.]
MYFGYEFIGEHRAFDWAQKAPNTDNWVIISERHCFDDVEHTRDAVSSAIMTNFAFEQGFTNLQFIALSADAKKYGDFSFAAMLQTVQSDEARHSQIGEPLIEIMMKAGRKDEAQRLVDISFWRVWKQFSALSGRIDRLLHTARAPRAFVQGVRRELRLHAVPAQPQRAWSRQALVLGRLLPPGHQHLSTTRSRSASISIAPRSGGTPWPACRRRSANGSRRNIPAGTTPTGQIWDVIIENILAGRTERTEPKILPMMCNMSGLELTGIAAARSGTSRAPPRPRWPPLSLRLRRRQVDLRAGARALQGAPQLHRSLRRRNDAGGPDGPFEYMSMPVGDRGVCGDNFSWVEGYRTREAAE